MPDTSLDNLDPERSETTAADLKKPLASGEARTLLPPAHDKLYVNDRMRKEYGARDGDVPYWARYGPQWEEHEGFDRTEEFIDTVEGGRVALGTTGATKGK